MYHLLRPLLKQTVSYRYLRAGAIVSRGTGWVERLVVDRPAISTFFTPLSICINVDFFEHLEFETRPDQLLVYTLVQGDERVVVEYAAVNGRAEAEEPEQQAFRFGSHRRTTSRWSWARSGEGTWARGPATREPETSRATGTSGD